MQSDRIVDVCIIGSGPAGLQAGYLLGKKGIDYTILERGAGVSDFFRHFPRHRQLISINKVHTGLSNPDTRLRFDWNSLLNDDGILFPDYSRKYFPPAEEMVRYTDDFAALIADRIQLNKDVTRISRDDGLYTIACADGTTQTARHVIVATGVSKPWEPQIEGFDLVENYYDFDTNNDRFTNKRVLVIGKGNSAFETADALVEHAAAIHVISPNPVRFAWNSHFVGHLRAVNNNFLDTYQLKSQNAVVDGEIFKIEKEGDLYTVHVHMSAAEGHDIILQYDHVIACTGFRFDPSIFDDAIRPEMKVYGKFPAMSCQWESEASENLWFAGTIMQCRDYRKTMSGFVHGFRHNVACLVEFIAGRVTGQAYPSDIVSLDADALTAEIIDRVSTSSGIFLQPGFLADVIELEGAHAGRRHRSVPIHWAREDGPATGTCLTVTLEFGDYGANPMHVKRKHTAFDDQADPFIHPVVRHYVDGELVRQVHMADHLDADWRRPEAKDVGAGTVTRQTFADLGQTVSPAEIAHRQLSRFLAEVGLEGAKTAAE